MSIRSFNSAWCYLSCTPSPSLHLWVLWLRLCPPSRQLTPCDGSDGQVADVTGAQSLRSPSRSQSHSSALRAREGGVSMSVPGGLMHPTVPPCYTAGSHKLGAMCHQSGTVLLQKGSPTFQGLCLPCNSLLGSPKVQGVPCAPKPPTPLG